MCNHEWPSQEAVSFVGRNIAPHSPCDAGLLLGSKDSGVRPVPSKDSRSLSLIVLLLTLTTAVVARQGASPGQAAPPATGTGVIYGRVVDAGDGSAIGEATVEVAVTSVVARVFTDGQGRFVFRDLPKASYALSGFANGFLNASIARPGRTASGDAR